MSTFKACSLQTSPEGNFSIGIEIDPGRGCGDSGSLETDLTDLAIDLSDGASDWGGGVCLFVDEMQDLLNDELAAICQACHESGQQSAQFYVVGAGLPSLPRVLAEAKSYAERLFQYRPIGALLRDDAAAAVERPAAESEVEWEREATQVVIQAANGYPYFLQEFGKAAWDYAPGPNIKTADAQAGVRVGTSNLDQGFYRSRWERATLSEREYMRAMAEDAGEPSQSGEVARWLGRTASAVGPTRANLIHKGLV